jgi:hypothetical protein
LKCPDDRKNGVVSAQATYTSRRFVCVRPTNKVDGGREAGLEDYRLSGVRLAAHAAGVSAATRWRGVSARPGRTLAR